ncbi:MAG: ABC transporter substrate-binding protein [Oscillospiraceae bacterium]
MKKVFSIVLAMVMAFALTACKGENAAKGTLTVGVIQLAQHPSLDEIYAAFEKQLNEEAAKAGITVKIDYQNGQGDPTNINTICQKFVGDKVDAIVAIASAPEGNITGTSDAIPVDKIFALAKELTPNVKSFGIVYNMGEPNSVVVVEQAKKYLADNGITLEESPITASGEVQMAAKNLSGKCDAIFVPIDNMVANAMPVLAQEAIAKGKPVYAAADSLVRDGALASVGVNYTNLGKKTADMLIKVLQGTAIKDIPVEILSDNAVVVNADTAKALNIDVSKYNK